MDEKLSYLERKRLKERKEEANATEPAQAKGAAAAFSVRSKSKTAKPAARPDDPVVNTKPERPQLVQSVPQTRKLLATAVAELDDLMKNR